LVGKSKKGSCSSKEILIIDENMRPACELNHCPDMNGWPQFYDRDSKKCRNFPGICETRMDKMSGRKVRQYFGIQGDKWHPYCSDNPYFQNNNENCSMKEVDITNNCYISKMLGKCFLITRGRNRFQVEDKS
jgi:hypothetical protein